MKTTDPHPVCDSNLYYAYGSHTGCGLLAALTLILACGLGSVLAAPSSLESDHYKIRWPNVNMGSGDPDSAAYNLGVTTGQIAPGLYSGTDFKIRAGFQYIHSIIPFSFTLSSISISFGSLTADVLTNEQTLDLTVDSGSVRGYQVTVEENQSLTSLGAGTTLPDVTCDVADTCTHIDEGAWAQTSTYGFGYTINGDDVPSEFASGTKFKNFALTDTDTPQKVMGLTPAGGHEAGKDKSATMTLRINPANIQPAGSYQNRLTFIATPLY